MTAEASLRSTVSAIVLAYGDEPWLEQCIYALLGSECVDVEVVLVDNGCTDGAVDRLRDVKRVMHVGDGQNLGFAGGCNLGVSAAGGQYVALVNGDLIVAPDAVARLVDVASGDDIGIAAGSVRLAEDPELLNTAGNEIHFLGFSWVGHFGEPASREAHARDIAGAMGAFLLLRRSVWEDLGGFEERYFAFHEDADLSWRCWQAGFRVRYVPDAVGVHRYEFGRVPEKLYLAERNRIIFVLTCWETRTLAVLAPSLVAVELGVTLVAFRGGWLNQKVAGWRWLVTHGRWLRRRRGQIRGRRRVRDRDLAHLWTSHLDARNFQAPPILQPFDQLLAGYWAVAKRLLGPASRPDDHDDADRRYAERLVKRSEVWWKRVFGAQLPYRWNLRRLRPGKSLEVGCGTGRNLSHLDGTGVGIDPNAVAVAIARGRGFTAYAPEEFLESPDARLSSFDSLLFAHVLEHLPRGAAVELITRYLPYLRPAGRVILITPQESGFRSDRTHVEFLDFAALSAIATACGLSPARRHSFPFPRWMGQLFRYNEFVVVATSE